MRPRKFPEHNRILQPPKGMNEDECLPLHVHSDGTQCVSCWELDDEDRKRIAAGGHIWAYVISGQTQPPIAITAENPFK